VLCVQGEEERWGKEGAVLGGSEGTSVLRRLSTRFISAALIWCMDGVLLCWRS
jgi:hypothetical protein